MKNNKSFLMSFLLISLCGDVLLLNAQTKIAKNSASSSINLKKVYVHDGKLSRKIILHFSKKPVVTYAPESIHEKERDENGLLKMTFFMPLVTVHDEANKEALESLSGMHSKDYGLSFSQVTKPMQGIKCLVAFNPDKEGFEYKTFQSITGDEGVMLQFYHQDILRKISESNNIRMQASVTLKKSTSSVLKKK
ncbi:hypothetical protein EBU24_03655 [bacterium]|nr:hypothetical protein [bacterium]